MTLGKKLDEVAVTNDVATAGRIADILRTRGVSYQKIAQLAASHGIDNARWEALMYAADGEHVR